MTMLTRRAFGGGAVAVAAATQMPLPASASSSFDLAELSAPLRDRVSALIEAYRAFQDAERRFGQRVNWCNGRPNWGLYFRTVLDAHHDLMTGLDDDASHARAVYDWANRLVRPPCARAKAFWTTIPDLSDDFAALHGALLEVRARYVLATYDFRSRYAPIHSLDYDGDNDDYFARARVIERAADAWFRIRHTPVKTIARTRGDRELARRIVECHATGDIIDVPYLQSVVTDSTPYTRDVLRLRRCGVDCSDCERLLGPRPAFRDDEEAA